MNRCNTPLECFGGQHKSGCPLKCFGGGCPLAATFKAKGTYACPKGTYACREHADHTFRHINFKPGKHAVVSKLPECDVCKIEFSSSKPNPARYDAAIAGSTWGYACPAHYSGPLGIGQGQLLVLWHEDPARLNFQRRNK